MGSSPSKLQGSGSYGGPLNAPAFAGARDRADECLENPTTFALVRSPSRFQPPQTQHSSFLPASCPRTLACSLSGSACWVISLHTGSRRSFRCPARRPAASVPALGVPGVQAGSRFPPPAASHAAFLPASRASLRPADRSRPQQGRWFLGPAAGAAVYGLRRFLNGARRASAAATAPDTPCAGPRSRQVSSKLQGSGSYPGGPIPRERAPLLDAQVLDQVLLVATAPARFATLLVAALRVATTIQYTYRRSPSSRYNCWSSLSTIGVRLIRRVQLFGLNIMPALAPFARRFQPADLPAVLDPAREELHLPLLAYLHQRLAVVRCRRRAALTRSIVPGSTSLVP